MTRLKFWSLLLALIAATAPVAAAPAFALEFSPPQRHFYNTCVNRGWSQAFCGVWTACLEGERRYDEAHPNLPFDPEKEVDFCYRTANRMEGAK
jgi:hypothetical protein